MYGGRKYPAVRNAFTAPKDHRQNGKRKGGEGLTPDPAQAWIDLDSLYGSCGAVLGLTRSQVDDHSLRDIYAMLDYAFERERTREREAWRRSLIQTQAVLNMMSRKPRELDFLAKKILGKDDSMDLESSDDVRRRIRESHQLALKRAREKNDDHRVSS